MLNLMTFDVEEWYHANYCDNIDIKRPVISRLACNLEKLLKLCSQNSCKATFFILGCTADKLRGLIREISSEGHEIASHGHVHELVYKKSFNWFINDIRKSVSALEDITGKKVIGYRAPSWSITETNIHFLEGLEKIGLKYDSSIFPAKTFLYGVPKAGRELYKLAIGGRELDVYEVPPSVFNFFGKSIGFSGGFYFRIFPVCMVDMLIKMRNWRECPALVYLHPREIDCEEGKLELSPLHNFIHYCNIAGTYGKLDFIMKKHSFTSIENYLKMLLILR